MSIKVLDFLLFCCYCKVQECDISVKVTRINLVMVRCLLHFRIKFSVIGGKLFSLEALFLQ